MAGGCRRSGDGGSLVAAILDAVMEGRVGVGVVEDTVAAEAGGASSGFASGFAAKGPFL
jgi:hypothetical protein